MVIVLLDLELLKIVHAVLIDCVIARNSIYLLVHVILVTHNEPKVKVIGVVEGSNESRRVCQTSSIAGCKDRETGEAFYKRDFTHIVFVRNFYLT